MGMGREKGQEEGEGKDERPPVQFKNFLTIMLCSALKEVA